LFRTNVERHLSQIETVSMDLPPRPATFRTVAIVELSALRETSTSMKPPSRIDGARVLEWAWSDTPFGELLSDDGSVAATVHGLALCRYDESDTVCRFSCNANWETEQDAPYSSLEEAKACLPQQYQRVPADWMKA
jgi:hypothetical protein